MANLFRQEVVEHQKGSFLGEMLISPSLSHSVCLGFCVVWATLLLHLITTFEFSRKESVVGWIEPSEGVVKVFPESNGMVKSIFVKNGDYVNEGDMLLAIEDERFLEGGRNLKSDLLSETQNQINLLNQEIAQENQIYQINLNDIRDQIASFELQRTMIIDEYNFLKSRENIINSQLVRLDSIQGTGNISLSELEQVREKLLTIKSERNVVQREKLIIENNLSQLEKKVELLPKEHTNKVNNLLNKISSLNQDNRQLAGEQMYIIKSFKSGVVNNLQVVEGQLVRPNGFIPLMTISPGIDNLEVKLAIPVKAIGFLQENQEVGVRYTAFPFEKYGIYKAKVTQISNTLLLPEELLNAPVKIEEPVYLVSAKLESNVVDAFGKKYGLKSGMTLGADIKTNERTLIEVLFEPVLSLKGRI